MCVTIASFPGSSTAFVAYCCTVCDKKLGRRLGTRLCDDKLHDRNTKWVVLTDNFVHRANNFCVVLVWLSEFWFSSISFGSL